MSYLNDLKRLVWRFNQASAFRPNDNDKEALKGIAAACKGVEAESLAQNRAFFNLYVYAYMKFCLFYHTTPDAKIPQVELHRMLDRSLDSLLAEFAEEMNLIEVERAIESELPVAAAKVWTEKELKKNLSAQFAQAVLNKHNGGKIRGG